MIESIKNSNLRSPQDVKIGLDVAANDCNIKFFEIMNIYNSFPIYSLEDPLKEEDWAGWTELKKDLEKNNKEFLLIGDDLFTTNEERLKKGIEENAANGIIIKLNQIGTLTETLNTMVLSEKSGITRIVSHRSGETEDSFIADLASGTGAKFIKAGAPTAPERLAKYNRLKEIKEII